MPLTTIVLRCAKCPKAWEYHEQCRGRSKIERMVAEAGWRRRLNGKRLEWICGECHAAPPSCSGSIPS